MVNKYHMPAMNLERKRIINQNSKTKISTKNLLSYTTTYVLKVIYHSFIKIEDETSQKNVMF